MTLEPVVFRTRIETTQSWQQMSIKFWKENRVKHKIKKNWNEHVAVRESISINEYSIIQRLH